MVDYIFQILPRLLLPVFVLLVLQLLRTYCRPDVLPESATGEPPPLAMLDRQFRRTQWGVTALWAACAISFAFGSWKLLRWSNRWAAELDGVAAYRLYPSEAIWWFVPMFGALTVGWVLMELLLPLVLGKDTARIYLYWTDAKAGFKASQVFRWASVLIAVPIFVLTLLALPVHTNFREDAIVFRAYASGQARTYRYGQIRALTTTDGFRDRVGKFVHDPCILIDFDDGTRWSSGDLLRDPDHVIDSGLKTYLARKTRLSFQHRRIERDLSASR